MAQPSDVADLLYAAALQPELWSKAMHELALAVGAMGTAVVPISTRGPRETLVSPEMREAAIHYQREWWPHDSRVARIEARGLSRGVFSEGELFTSEEVARDPFRQEFLRQYGMGVFAAQIVAPLPKLVVSISVQRALGSGPFEKRELKLLSSLGKHAARAVTVALRLAAARTHEKTLLGTLARLTCGALVLDDHGCVVFMNETAERLMGDGLSTAQRALRATSADHQPLLDRLIASARRRDDQAPSGLVALPRQRGQMPLLLKAIPIRASEPSDEIDRLLFAGPTILVIVVDPEREHEHSPVEALRLLGLARAEARIAALVGTGRSRREAAEALGISEWTAREALKRVFLKLNISRQSELMKLVQRLAVLAEPPDRSR